MTNCFFAPEALLIGLVFDERAFIGHYFGVQITCNKRLTYNPEALGVAEMSFPVQAGLLAEQLVHPSLCISVSLIHLLHT